MLILFCIERFSEFKASGLCWYFKCQTWEDDATKRIGYIWTETEPRVYWKPKTAFPKFLNMAEKTENEILGKYFWNLPEK